MKFIIKTLFLLLLISGNCFAQTKSEADKFRESDDYLKYLIDFKEPQIFPLEKKDINVIRLFVLPTFENPILIRVENNNGKITLFAKRLRGQGGYEIKGIKKQKQRQLNADEWGKLTQLLKDANFGESEVKEKFPEPDKNGIIWICDDGVKWLLERNNLSGYHATEQRCNKSNNFIAIGDYLLKLSGLKIDYNIH